MYEVVVGERADMATMHQLEALFAADRTVGIAWTVLLPDER